MENLNFYNLIENEIFEDKEIINNLESASQKKLIQNTYMMKMAQNFLKKLQIQRITTQQDQS